MTVTIHDVWDLPPVVNNVYSHLSLKDILNTTLACRVFKNAFELSDIFLIYSHNIPSRGLTRREWTLLHIKTGSLCRREWLTYWDESRLETRRYQLSHFWVSPELSSRLVYERKAIHDTPVLVGLYAGMKIGFWGGAKVGALAGTCVVPGVGTVSGAAVGGVVGLSAGGLAGLAIGHKIGNYGTDCFDHYILTTNEYKNFKVRVGKEVLEYIINVFSYNEDPVCNYYRCGLGGNLADPDVEFAEGPNRILCEVNELRTRIPDSSVLTWFAFKVIELPQELPRESASHVLDLTGNTQTPEMLFAGLNYLNGVNFVSPYHDVDVGVRISDLDVDINSADFCLKEAKQLTLIRSYRAAYAVLRRKIYLLTTGILKEQIQSPALKTSRKTLLEEWEVKSRDIKQLAQRQINAFVDSYDSSVSRQIRDPMRQQLNAELEMAGSGTKEVIFTPLLDLDAIFARQKLAAHMHMRASDEAAISQDALALSYGCSLSHRLPDDLHSLIEDRNGHLFDLNVHDRQGWQELGIRLTDLDADIDSADFSLEEAKNLTIIRGYRAAYAVLCRKIYLLKDLIIENQNQSGELKLSRKELLAEWELKSQKIKELAKEQINAFVDLYEGCASRQLRNAMKKQLNTELELASLGTQEVTFTPLLDLDAAFANLQQPGSHRGN